jgi:oligosaccharide repeat unit polymerase
MVSGLRRRGAAHPRDVPGDSVRHTTANPAAMGGLLVLLCGLQACLFLAIMIVPAGQSDQLIYAVSFGTLAIGVLYFLSVMQRPERAHLIGPDFVFLGILALFHIPTILFITLGWVAPESPAKWWYDVSVVNRTMLLVLSGFTAFMIGYNIAAKPPAFYASQPHRPAEFSDVWVHIGQGIFAAGFLLIAYFATTQIGWSTLLKGAYSYSRYQNIGLDQRLWFFGMYLCITGITIIVCYSAALYRSPAKGLANKAIVLVYVGFIFLTGHRNQVLAVVLAVLLSYGFLGRRFTNKSLIIIAIVGAIGMSAGKVIRNVADKSVSRVRQALTENKDVIGLQSALVEAGGSVRTIFRTVSLVPHRDSFRYGSTLFESSLRALPGMGEPLIRLGLMGESLSQWLMRTTEPKSFRQGHGWGFSIIGEAYVNFGPIGPTVFLFVIGVFLRRLFDRAFYQHNPYRMVIAITCLVALVHWIRNDSYSSMRPIIWIFILMAVFRMFLGTRPERAQAGAAGRVAAPAQSASSP